MTAYPSEPLDREQQICRAREVLSDAGWLFDDFVNNEMRKVLVSQPEDRDAREEAYRRARVATEMKAGLESLIETYEADARLKERRSRNTAAVKGSSDSSRGIV